jgi:hypothetical protein
MYKRVRNIEAKFRAAMLVVLSRGGVNFTPPLEGATAKLDAHLYNGSNPVLTAHR